MSDTLGFGIAGCGMIAAYHAEAIEDIDGAEVVATWDVAEEPARELAETHDVDWYTDYDAFIGRDDLHVVNICSPSGTHAKAGVPAAEAGKHVIVEKPLEITLEKCDRLISAAEQAGTKLAVIFQSRFKDDARLAKDAVEADKLGDLVYAEATVKWFRDQEYYDTSEWKGTWELDGGGALMNQAIHAIDQLQWLAGSPEQVSAYCAALAHERIEVEDTATASLRFENGALGSVTAMTSAYPGYAKRIELYGTEGSIVLEDDELVRWNFRDESEEDMQIKERIRRAAEEEDEAMGAASASAGMTSEFHRREIEDVIEAIREDGVPAISGQEGRKSVELIRGIYRSAEAGGPVTFPLD